MPIAYIGLGANLPSRAGSPEATLAAAAARIESLGRIAARSSLYSTAPVGFANQPRFFNAVLALETDLSPREMLEALQAIEHEFGRDRGRGVANGPRTLDLDILLFGDVVLSELGLEIPHPRLAERAFVLVPLHEVAPQALEPRTGRSVSQLLKNLVSNPSDASDAVVQIQSELWRAGTAADVADAGDS